MSCPSFQAFSASQSGCLIPWYEQYLPWLGEFFSYDIGNIFSIYSSAGGVTVELLIVSSGLLIVFGLVTGLVAAARHNSAFDNLSRFIAYILFSVPTFVTALLLKTALSYDIYLGGRPLLQAYGQTFVDLRTLLRKSRNHNVFHGNPFDRFPALGQPELSFGIRFLP